MKQYMSNGNFETPVWCAIISAASLPRSNVRLATFKLDQKQKQWPRKIAFVKESYKAAPNSKRTLVKEQHGVRVSDSCMKSVTNN